MAKREEFSKVRKEDELERRLVSVRRVVKVVKGGRTLNFSATMVVGDKKGKVGIGNGKASETSVAVEKAFQAAKKNMQYVNIVGSTIPHEVEGKFGTSTILLLPAKEGTGVIAGGAVRDVVELAGIRDITTKLYGSNNPANCVKATFDGLSKLRSAETIARLRGKKVEEI